MILELDSLVEALEPRERERFARIYRVGAGTSGMSIPDAMRPWVEQHFGQVEEVERQRLVRVSNVVTGEAALFNSLRGQRPVRKSGGAVDYHEALKTDVWANPLEATPADLFGRIESVHGVTAANIAKFDVHHSLIVFRDADPLAFTAESLRGHVTLAQRWFEAVHAADAAAVYPYLMWNCLWRAGGSVVHGHFQVAMARGRHYARIERLRADAEAYRRRHGVSYFEDMRRVHRALGLAGWSGAVETLAHLTPLKEKEVLIIGDTLDDRLIGAAHAALRAFRDSMGVQSFNMAVLLPPVAPVDESWEGFPMIVRIVDRGPLDVRTSDWGGMEMFAESVVAADPFQVAAVLRDLAPSVERKGQR